MSGFRPNIRYFLYVSILLMVALLAAQAGTLYYFAADSMRVEANEMQATYMNQLNNSINFKINNAEYAIKLLENYMMTGTTPDEAMRHARDTLERNNLNKAIVNDLSEMNEYVSSDIRMFLLSAEYAYNIEADFPKIIRLESGFGKLSFISGFTASAQSARMLTGSRQKAELADFVLANLPESANESVSRLFRDMMSNSVVIASLKDNASGYPHLAFVVLPYRDLIRMGSGTSRDIVLLSEHFESPYDPFGLLADDKASQAASRNYETFSAYNANLQAELQLWVPKSSVNADIRAIGFRLTQVLAVSLVLAVSAILLLWNHTLILPVRRLLQAIHRNANGPLRPRFRTSAPPLGGISLKYKFLISNGLLFLVISNLLTYACYAQTKAVIERSRYALYETIADNSASNLQTLFAAYRSLSRFIALDPNVQVAARAGDIVPAGTVDRITRTILNNPFNIVGLNNVSIYSREGALKYSFMNVLSSDARTMDLMTRLGTMNLYGKLYWSTTERDSLNNNKFSVIREIRDANRQDAFRRLGYVRIAINESVFDDLFKQTNRISYEQLVVDGSGRIVSSGDKNQIGRLAGEYRALDGNEFLTLEKSLNSNDWKILLLVSRKEVNRYVNSNIVFNLYISLAFMTAMILFLFFFYNRLVRPILRLNQFVKGVHTGGQRPPFRTAGGNYDEINELGENINMMIVRINRLIEENYVIKLRESHMENRKKEVDMQALQSQINPHFIYNTLDTINWTILLNKPQEAVDMLTSFSHLLRLSVSKGQVIVPVPKELQHVQAYMDIQKIRYGERLAFILDVAEEPLRCRTLNLILQPLIENAVNYGLEGKKNRLTVVVRGYVDAQRNLIFKISDDGIGIARDKLKELNNTEQRAAGGIGLQNVRERIRLHFGDRYGMRIHSIPGAGTTVLLTLPYMKEGDGK